MTSSDVECMECWNDGPPKEAIVDFVERVTREGGPDYVPPAERIAAFDNDGTLWCEFPMQVQVFFALAEVKRLAAQDPSLLQKPAFKAMVDGDLKALASLPKKEVFEPAFATHAGMTVEEFHENAQRWLAQAKHPTLKQPFTQGAYLPQCELLTYLRVNGFKTYIVTGGGVEFVRVVAEELYGIPPEQVIGSSTKMKLDTVDGKTVLRKLPELASFDDRDEKVVNIALHIGRRPIFAFGNSDGDLAMIRYTLGGDGPRMAWYLHHDDAEREFAYDRDFKLSPLREGLDRAAEYGIGMVSMKNDWREVFAR
ncbi:HAD family hydrolase [Lysobacter niastensis]|uniref:Haloacid dehalogenase-like hydrolase n=1 Tax=Lysobacter niastensis TaxID=380629 RepID=A0ABS0BE36_9GAMM|nr:HAD family hydrolase [Lysobacter niastensis]MBF6026031.1 haloacid dehalogenase-like hydrolase [Lysobacter niastensis]